MFKILYQKILKNNLSIKFTFGKILLHFKDFATSFMNQTQKDYNVW